MKRKSINSKEGVIGYKRGFEQCCHCAILGHGIRNMNFNLYKEL